MVYSVGGWDGVHGASTFRSTDWSSLAQGTVSSSSFSSRSCPALSSLSSRCALSPPRRPSRLDLPVVKKRRSANHHQVDDLLSTSGISACLASLDGDRYAASSSNSFEDRIATWNKFHAKVFGHYFPVFPLSVSAYNRVAAVFKGLGYQLCELCFQRQGSPHRTWASMDRAA